MRSFFCQKEGPSSANAEFFGQKKKALPSANAEDKKKQEKKFASSGTRTRVLNFADHCSTHYSIPPSVISDNKIAHMKKA